MYLVIFLLAAIWVLERNKNTTVASTAARTGGWHPPIQTARLGGWSIRGNQWDNGTDTGQLNPQWSGYDAPIGNITFAVEGGQDGGNPSLPSLSVSSSPVVTLGRFQLLGGGEPEGIPAVPIQIDDLSPVVRRA